MFKPAYKRILLKLSGESLMGGSSQGLNFEASQQIAFQIKKVLDLGVQVGLVIGGGNIFRGIQGDSSYCRSSLDQMGMLATVINGIMLSEAFTKLGCDCKVLSSVDVGFFVEKFDSKLAKKYLESGSICIFVGGTGNPYFSTDSAAALRALEINADILFKATKVDGIYDKDPKRDLTAKKYEAISYDDVLRLHLNVMDATAIALCRDNHLPIRVFNVFSNDNLMSAICNLPIGTLVEG